MVAILWDTGVMGRHSAPETEPEGPEPQTAEGVAGPADALVTEAGAERGGYGATDVLVRARHSRPESQEHPELAPVTPAPSPAARSGDLALLRASAGLRWRCVAVVVLAFLVYTAVLVALGRTDVYLIWVWIPTVASGVGVGALLDLAARARVARGAAGPDLAAPDPAAPDTAGLGADGLGADGLGADGPATGGPGDASPG